MTDLPTRPIDTVDTWTAMRARAPKLVPDFALTTERTALLIVDMQEAFYQSDEGLGGLVKTKYPDIAEYYFPRMRDIVVPNNATLIEAFRRAGLRIIYLTTGPWLSDRSDMFWRRRVRDASEAISTHARPGIDEQVIAELAPREGELVLHRNCAGAFNGCPLDQILRNMDIVNLVITGVQTDSCVETTARDAADRGYLCHLVEDACATHFPERQQAAMDAFSMFYGNVVSTADVVKVVQGGR